MRDHTPHPNAPKCWICDGMLGSCGHATGDFNHTRKLLLEKLDSGIGALVQTAYDFAVSRKGDQLYLEGRTTVDQKERYILADISTWKPISGLSVDQVQLILQAACLLLNDAATIGPLLFKHYRGHGVDV